MVFFMVILASLSTTKLFTSKTKTATENEKCFYINFIPILKNMVNLINKDPMFSWEIDYSVSIYECIFIKGNRILFSTS